MIEVAEIITSAGRAAVELVLFVLLPVMMVMLTLMRLLEAWGVLAVVVRLVTPLLRPLGIPGLGIFAMLQILFVGFAAPVATLAMMDRAGVSSRHLAATLAMVLVLAQANVVFPMAAMGLQLLPCVLISIVSAVLAAALCYHGFGRSLDSAETVSSDELVSEQPSAGLLALINRAGRDALDIAINALPMLVLALVAVYALRAAGVIGVLESAFGPALASLSMPPAAVLPIVTKFIAGGTAMMGVAVDAMQQGLISELQFNRMAGLLIHPLDVAGVAVLISAGRRVAAVVRPALLAALLALLLRALLQLWWF